MTKLPLDVFREIFESSPFINSLGITLVSASAGECRTELRLKPEHFQQTGVVHAGVLATMADHTGGGAAGTLLDRDSFPLTSGFSISLLRGATGNTLVCRARVLKPGRSLIVAESEVFSIVDGVDVLVAKATVTLAIRRRS